MSTLVSKNLPHDSVRTAGSSNPQTLTQILVQARP